MQAVYTSSICHGAPCLGLTLYYQCEQGNKVPSLNVHLETCFCHIVSLQTPNYDLQLALCCISSFLICSRLFLLTCKFQWLLDDFWSTVHINPEYSPPWLYFQSKDAVIGMFCGCVRISVANLIHLGLFLQLGDLVDHMWLNLKVTPIDKWLPASRK